MDSVDRLLLASLQEDATQSYAALGAAAGLSTAAAHERVRKLRERGVIRRTTIDVDPVAVGQGVLAYVMIEADAWIGGSETGDALRALSWVEEAHIVAGGPSVLVKIRTATTAALQAALKAIFEIRGVTGTRTIVVLDTFFERPIDVMQSAAAGTSDE